MITYVFKTIEEEIAHIETFRQLDMLSALANVDGSVLFSPECERLYLRKLFFELKDGYTDNVPYVEIKMRMKNLVTWAACLSPENEEYGYHIIFTSFRFHQAATRLGMSIDPDMWRIFADKVMALSRSRPELKFSGEKMYNDGFITEHEQSIVDLDNFIFSNEY